MGKFINLRTQLPIQNMKRILFCQALREIGSEKIEQLPVKHHIFLETLLNNDGGDYAEIDWHFVLFEATSHQMDMLLENFEVKPPESKIIQG